ncbi:hypothetical protein BDZ89DRAFT_1149685, partial [Hymenopellis radicata]
QSVPESSKLALFPITQEPETACEIEPDTTSTSIPQQDVKTRSTVRNSHEVLKILDSSDSEVEPEDDASSTAYNGDTSDYVDEVDELLVPSLTLSSYLLPARFNPSLCVERDEKDADSETVMALNPTQEPIDLPATKANIEYKELLRKCIQAIGAQSSTVQSIDKGHTSDGLDYERKGTCLTCPSVTPVVAYRPSSGVSAGISVGLRDRRHVLITPLSNMVLMSIAVLMGLVRIDTEQPLAEHGVHTVMMSPSGGTLVYTGYSYLLNLVHDAFANGLRVDATFRRVYGELKEWEIAIWYAPAAQAVTIARIYTNKAD